MYGFTELHRASQSFTEFHLFLQFRDRFGEKQRNQIADPFPAFIMYPHTKL